jgi:hypothetical protein
MRKSHSLRFGTSWSVLLCFILTAGCFSTVSLSQSRCHTPHMSCEVFTVPYVRGYIYLEAQREADVRRWGVGLCST